MRLVPLRVAVGRPPPRPAHGAEAEHRGTGGLRSSDVVPRRYCGGCKCRVDPACAGGGQVLRRPQAAFARHVPPLVAW